MVPLPISFRRRVLPNGLVALTHESHLTTTAAIQVWYKVGSKDDPPGRSGFAHLFEHLMFKRTRNMADEQLDRFTEDIGGSNNAYTSPDVTVYHEVVPSNHLERLLWAEADRMASLQVDESNFFSERDVVKEEYREGVLANPYGRLEDALEVHSWLTHPYKRPTIGNIAELDAATAEDVRAFHTTFYRPDNAVLVIAGDFDPVQCDAWIDRYFGRISQPSTPIPRVSIAEPPRSAPRRFEVLAPDVPLPALGMTHLLPGQRHPDAAALQMLDTVLSGGEAARFHQSLIYRQQLASEATTSADLRTDAGLFLMRVTAAGGKTLDRLERALLAELALVQKAPVSTAELDRARTRVLSEALHTRETVEGIASALGHAEVLLGEAQRINTDLATLLSVTAEELQRVARQYLVEANRVTVRYRAGKVAEPMLSPKRTAPKSPRVPPEEAAPVPALPRKSTLPAITDRRLGNGLRVLHAPRQGSGLVTLELVFPQGGGSVASSKAGLSALVTSLLTRGTTTKSASELAVAAEALGGNFEVNTGWDSLAIGLTVPQTNKDKALALLSEVVRHPAFSAGELARRRAEMIDEATVDLEEPMTLARGIGARLLFGQSSYGSRLGGLPATLKKLSRADVLGFYQSVFAPGTATLVLTGDLAAEDALALATKHLSSWHGMGQSLAARPAFASRSPKLVLLDKPGAGQAAVYLTLPSLRRSDPRYPIAAVANSVLGGGYSSRLNRAVRIERGLSYGAGSGLSARRLTGFIALACQTKNESAAEVAVLFRTALQELITGPLGEEELSARKSALLGPLSRELETSSGLASALAERAALGMPLLELPALLTRIPTVTASEVRAFATTGLDFSRARLVIVGEAHRFRSALEKNLGPAVIWKKWGG